jgi:hypothetical protein
MTDKIQATSQLTQAVRESRLLLTYAAQAGLELDEKMLQILVNAQYHLDQDDWTNEDEADFWQAFSTLNVIIKPVTLESLKAVALVDTKSSRFRLLKIFFSKAYRAVGLYIVLSLLYMFLLLTFQVYWLTGKKLTQNLTTLTREKQQFSQLIGVDEEKYPEEYKALLMQIETTRATLLLWSKPWNWRPFVLQNDEEYRSLIQKDYITEINLLQEELKKAANRLYYFKDFGFENAGIELVNTYQTKVSELTEQLLLKKAAYEKKQNEYLFTEIELKTRYVLHILQRYILPLLYGLLGATAYVMRSLINDIQNKTYTGKLGVRYGVRTSLGALAGLMIGIIPKGTGGLSTLPPMAISFLAGYNVEVLFALMDRFIVSVLKKRGIVKTDSSTEEQVKE